MPPVKMEKAPQALIDAFDAALPDDPRAVRKVMFGYPAAFVGGNMFAGVFAASVFVRLPEGERGELPGARPLEPMPGRPMKDYVVLPDAVVADAGALRRWVARGFEHGARLAPKETKPKKAR